MASTEVLLPSEWWAKRDGCDVADRLLSSALGQRKAYLAQQGIIDGIDEEVGRLTVAVAEVRERKRLLNDEKQVSETRLMIELLGARWSKEEYLALWKKARETVAVNRARAGTKGVGSAIEMLGSVGGSRKRKT